MTSLPAIASGIVCSWIGLASTKPAFSISANNSADKCNSLNFNVLLLSKGGAKPPYKAFDTHLSKHDKCFRLINLDSLRVFALLFINMVSQVQALKKRRLGR